MLREVDVPMARADGIRVRRVGMRHPPNPPSARLTQRIGDALLVAVVIPDETSAPNWGMGRMSSMSLELGIDSLAAAPDHRACVPVSKAGTQRR